MASLKEASASRASLYPSKQFPAIEKSSLLQTSSRSSVGMSRPRVNANQESAYPANLPSKGLRTNENCRESLTGKANNVESTSSILFPVDDLQRKSSLTPLLRLSNVHPSNVNNLLVNKRTSSHNLTASSSTIDRHNLNLLYKIERAQNPDLNKPRESQLRTRFDSNDSLHSLNHKASPPSRQPLRRPSDEDDGNFQSGIEPLEPLQFPRGADASTTEAGVRMGDVARTEAIRWPGNSARNEDRCAERVSDGRDSGQRDSGNGAPSRRGSFAASDGRRSSLAACDRRRDSLHRRASFQTERSSFQVLEDHMRIMMRSVRQASLSEDAADASQDSLATGSPARASTPEAARMDRESVRARAAHGQRASVSPAVKPRTGVFAKLGKRAEEAVRTLAKNAKRRQKIHKLWTWAIGKVIKMIQATNAITSKNYYDIQADLRMLEETHAAHKKRNGLSGLGELGFKLDTYKVVDKPGGSAKIMAALMKVPEARTEHDIRLIRILTATLPGFLKYSEEKRQKLSENLLYSRFNSNRVIVKQGHMAQNYYFIISGELEVTKSVDDRSSYVGTLTASMAFGELALLEGEQGLRTATVTTTKETELLWLMRDEFDEILKEETIKEIEERRAIIAGHDNFFKELGDEAHRQLAMTSQTFRVEAGMPVISEGDMLQFVLLMCEGEYSLSKVIPFAKVKLTDRSEKYQMHPFPIPSGVDLRHGYTVVHKLIRFAKMEKNRYYGVAGAIATAGNPNQVATAGAMCDLESLKKAPFSVVATSKLKYIGINKYTLVKEMVRHPHLVKVSIKRHGELLHFLANTQEIQQLYLERRIWDRHKKQIMDETIYRSKNHTLMY